MNAFTRAHVQRYSGPDPTQVQIHQYNDAELIEFFNRHRVEYDLIGDHLFIIRSRSRDLAAGLGDWLVVSADGEIAVEPGDCARRARQAIKRTKNARRGRSKGVQGNRADSKLYC